MNKLTLAAACMAAAPVFAEGVGITKEMTSVAVPGTEIEISRIQDQENKLSGDWALTSRACPPFCVQPMQPAEGVTTIGELELIALLQDPEAVVIDSRTPEWFDKGSIPGAVNLPYNQMVDHLGELGCEIDFDGWVCEEAKTIALFCNGPWCGQSPSAIRRIVEAGYPSERIHYYRGGMQVWRMLGLSVTD